MWMLPLYLHVNQKSYYDIMMISCELSPMLADDSNEMSIYFSDDSQGMSSPIFSGK